MNADNNVLVMFHDGAFELDVRISASENTVWLTLDQIASLFEKDKSTVSRHIKNIFSEGELDKEAVVANYATTASDGKTYQVDYYNLDLIISVGYRVKSKRGVAFRKWATSVLNDYLLKGYAENRRLLEAQGKTIELQTRMIAHLTETDGTELMDVINRYTEVDIQKLSICLMTMITSALSDRKAARNMSSFPMRNAKRLSIR